MASDYTGSYTGITKGEQISAADMTAALNKMEKVANKKDVVNNSSTEYPSSRAVYELVCPGIIYTYAGATAPTGWAFCDGQAVSRTAYPKLFEAIGTTWGVGNGSTTFNIPDLRGATIRGAGTTAYGLYKDTINGVTTNAQQVSVYLAEVVNDAIRNITGDLELQGRGGTSGALSKGEGGYSGHTGSSWRIADSQMYFNASWVVPTANENRVKARGVNFIIKLV